MNIRGRILKLEARAAPCGCIVCGYPRTGVYRVIVRPDANPLPKCTSCGKDLDDDSAPLHEPYSRVVLDHPEWV